MDRNDIIRFVLECIEENAYMAERLRQLQIEIAEITTKINHTNGTIEGYQNIFKVIEGLNFNEFASKNSDFAASIQKANVAGAQRCKFDTAKEANQNLAQSKMENPKLRSVDSNKKLAPRSLPKETQNTEVIQPAPSELFKSTPRSGNVRIPKVEITNGSRTAEESRAAAETDTD